MFCSQLITYFLFMYALMTWTYGIGAPTGLFVPSLAVGAAGGQIVGRVVRAMVMSTGSDIVVDLHAYAVMVSLFLFLAFFWQFWQFLAMVCVGNWTDGVFCAQGIVDTELPRSLSLNFYPLLRSTGGLITPAQGARGQIDACIGDAWEGISGKYVAEQSGPGGSEVGPGGKKGVFKVTESSKYSYDQEAAARLWKVSKALTGASWEALGEGKVEKESMAVSSWM